jgi:hypothetical protein
MPPQGFWLLSNWTSRKVKWGRERKKEKKNIIKIAHPSHDAYVRKDVSPSTWRLVWYWDAAFITAENTSIHTPVEQHAGETNNQAKTEHFKEMKSETFQDNYLIFFYVFLLSFIDAATYFFTYFYFLWLTLLSWSCIVAAMWIVTEPIIIILLLFTCTLRCNKINSESECN